jgi:hypothetical protein
MSTTKISELPKFSTINANTSNTLFVGVDIPSAQTFQFSAHTLAQGLYLNETLIVGNNTTLLPNTSAQFSLAGESYVQTNFVNLNGGGTADHVITANNGTDSTYFLDLGFANPGYQPGAEFNNLGTAINPLDGYLYVQGNGTGNLPGGNLMIGTTTANTEIRFVGGGSGSNNIVAKITGDGLKMVNGHPIYFTDGTTQNTAAAPFAYSNAAFALANTTVTNQAAINSTQNTSITAAFTKANNALANTTGIFAGDLTLTGNLIATGIQSTTDAITTGNLIVNGTTTSNGTANITGTLNVAGIVNMNAQVVLTNTSFSATQAALTITATPTVSTPSQDGYMIHISGKQNVSSRIVADSYGANTYVVYAGRSARGNVSNPSAVKTGDILTRFSGNGYGTTGYAPLGSGRLDIVAIEDHTDTARGTQLQLWNTPVGTNTLTNIATFNGVDVVFTGEVNPQKGFVLTPNVISGITTTLSIDIANTSLFSFKTNATTTISLSGYKTGKIVEVWLTNTDTGGGSNHTITHGCLANNSTIGTASFTLSSLHSAYIKYFSIDGDLANTFCQVTYS